MKLKKVVRRMMDKAARPKRTAKLELWRQRLDRNRQQYQAELEAIERREAVYGGTKSIRTRPGKGMAADANTVRNIVYELIESQIDSSIPQPKVTAVHPEDEEQAKLIEDMLRGELDRQPFERLNDLDERTTYIQGGDYWLVDWNSERGTHTTRGQLEVSLRHPRMVIPQDGITNLEDMDYVILQVAMTKEQIRRRYGVDVSDEEEEAAEVRGENAQLADDLVTQSIAYYRNERGGIGRFSWVSDIVLEDQEDYQARRLRRCKVCGEVMNGERCPMCGGKAAVEAEEEWEELAADVTLADGTVLPARQQVGEETQLGPAGMPLLDETGRPIVLPVQEATRVPYYKPDVFPLVLRRSTSNADRLLGFSDVDAIEDQQENVKKLGSKINEKILTAGSFVTLPTGVKIEMTDGEMKVVRVANPQQKALIDTMSMQPDISTDASMLESNYQWAKSTLGINDSFQGKRDSTATSGTAKQFAAAQTAGRLESKRTMKNAAYADLFRLMFQFMLAYADEPRPVASKNVDGDTEYRVFDRYRFLKQDAAGELYWNDEFLFSVDTSGTLAANREAMWQETRTNYQSGAFGDPSQRQTQLLFWTLMESLHYPKAGEIRTKLESLLEEEKAAEQMMQAQDTGVSGQEIGGQFAAGMSQAGGVQDALPFV